MKAWIGRASLWTLTIFLASLGGSILHEATRSSDYGGGRSFETFFGLVFILTAAAIYSRKLRW